MYRIPEKYKFDDPRQIASNVEWFHKYSFFIDEVRSRGMEITPEYQWLDFKNNEYEYIFVQSILEALKHYSSIEDRYMFIGLLGGTKTPYDPSEAIKLFNQLTEPWWKNHVLSALTQSNPAGIAEWYIELLLDKDDPFIQNSMATYIGYSKEYCHCQDILIEHYSEFPMGALNAFEAAGGEKELAFLKQFNHESVSLDDPRRQATYIKHLPKVIKKLENRVKRRKKK